MIKTTLKLDADSAMNSTFLNSLSTSTYKEQPTQG